MTCFYKLLSVFDWLLILSICILLCIVINIIIHFRFIYYLIYSVQRIHSSKGNSGFKTTLIYYYYINALTFCFIMRLDLVKYMDFFLNLLWSSNMNIHLLKAYSQWERLQTAYQKSSHFSSGPGLFLSDLNLTSSLLAAPVGLAAILLTTVIVFTMTHT